MAARSRHWRSFVKGMTWESFSWFLTAGIAYLYLGEVGESTGLATICLGVKIVFFWLHERLWHNIEWGKL